MGKTSRRIPDYLQNPEHSRREIRNLKVRLRRAGLHTVCESARCPNIFECFKRPQAAFMVMGNRCGRGCGFCAVERGAPKALDPGEPREVARAAAELGLRHVVVTSVTRDDLPDGGASHFAAVINAIKEELPGAAVEVLTPDFQGDLRSMETVVKAGPHVFNHNLETVPRLYPSVRPAAGYDRSLAVLREAGRLAGELEARVLTKSGLMLGLGENMDEVLQVMSDLAGAGVSMVTVGQYLQPRRDRLPVERYVEPEEYEELARRGEAMGLTVFAGPLVRSSYLADRVFEGVKKKIGRENPVVLGGEGEEKA